VETLFENVASDGKISAFEREIREGVRIRNDESKEGFDKEYYSTPLSITKTI
jgi:hypothetical protein